MWSIGAKLYLVVPLFNKIFRFDRYIDRENKIARREIRHAGYSAEYGSIKRAENLIAASAMAAKIIDENIPNH